MYPPQNWMPIFDTHFLSPLSLHSNWWCVHSTLTISISIEVFLSKIFVLLLLSISHCFFFFIIYRWVLEVYKRASMMDHSPQQGFLIPKDWSWMATYFMLQIQTITQSEKYVWPFFFIYFNISLLILLFIPYRLLMAHRPATTPLYGWVMLLQFK